jgi:hypothetical protein
MARHATTAHRVGPRRALLGMSLLAGSLVVASCSAASSSPSPSHAPSLPPSVAASAAATATPLGSAAPAIQIQLAPNWQKVELTAAALTAQMQVLAKSNPQQAAIFQQLLNSGALNSIQFYALGYDGINLIGNINATNSPLGGPLDAAVPVFEGEMRQLGAVDVEIQHATLLGGDAIVVNYHLPMNAGATSVVFTGRISVIPVGTSAWVVTVTCYASDPSSCLADGDAMVAGMTIGP